MKNVIQSERQKESFDLFRLLSRHPYICLAVTMIFIIPFGLGQKEQITNGMIIYGCIVACVILIPLGFSKTLCDTPKRTVIFLSVSLSLVFLFGMLSITQGFRCDLLMLVAFVIVIISTLLLYTGNELDTKKLIIMAFAVGFILRLIYVLATDSGSRQHDVGFFNWKWGHSNYIEYWFNNGLKLPDFDVRTIWQYYHPPLHHWLMALFLRILVQLGVEYEAACCAIQLLPMLYSSMIMIVSYKIFASLKLKGTSLFLPCLVIAFHPFFIIFSGAYNNDILSILFILLAVLFTIRWYKEPTMKRIIPIALSVGLGMMTKLSVWMIAPAIALIFLINFIRSKKKGQTFLQFVVFGVICVPLALWWQVRNFLLFDVPITYVPNLGKNAEQYLGNMSIASRLFDFSQIRYPYDGFPDYGSPFYEFNPILGLFKTAVFDEGTNAINDTTFPQISFIGPVILYISIALFLLCFVMFIMNLFRKKSVLNADMKIFFGTAAAVFLIFYFLFCFQYPHTCTMNMRYCAPVIVFLLLGMGVYLQDMNEGKEKKIMTSICAVLSGAFSFASMIMFLLIC